MGLSRFGGLWVTNIPTAVATTTVPSILTAWTLQGSGPKGATGQADADAGTITIRTPGWYLAHCSLSFDGDAGRTFYAEFRVNGVVGSHYRASAEGIASGGRVNLAFLGGANLHRGDVVSIYVYSDLAATMTIVDGQFGLISI